MKNTRTHRQNVIKKEGIIDKTFKSSFLGILITVGIGFIIMFASTAAALLTDDPTSFISPIGYISVFITSFLGGFVCSKINKHSPYIVAIICGADFVILSMLFSFALPHSFASGMNIQTRLLLHTLSFILFPVGAFAGTKASKPQRKRR
jgi:putative membrane protein (TIGR04086 family)